jgi:4-diphosphocytidyl-2-C-methyl-D-erythritol kinase
MARLELADEIELAPRPGPGDRLTFEAEGLGPLGKGFAEGNLALAALKALRAVRPDLGYYGVHIKKRIPLAAGLGGGSSDAAAILKALGGQLGLAESQVLGLALSLGSDLPFFLGPPLALAQGRGEILSPWGGELPKWAVLVNPGFPLATGQVFRALALTNGGENNNLVPDSPPRPEAPPLGRNDLLAPALAARPGLEAAQAAVAGMSGAEAHGLSGSGPTFWALFRDRETAGKALESLAGRPFWAALTSLEGA